MKFDGVLVWVNPIDEGRTRNVLDGILRDVAARGPWVSAHPDVILKMGVKEVLFRTKHLGWGTETCLYQTVEDFLTAFPTRLRSAGPRVLKQNRGNGGQGVWKVELIDGSAGEANIVSVLHARRGSVPEKLLLKELVARCEPYFASGGCLIDQPFQPRLPEGMIRCYIKSSALGTNSSRRSSLHQPKALIPQRHNRVRASCMQPTPCRFKHSEPRWKPSGHRR
jgi:hypothetical protein